MTRIPFWNDSCTHTRFASLLLSHGHLPLFRAFYIGPWSLSLPGLWLEGQVDGRAGSLHRC